jgi:hypothetical protein
MSRHPHTIELMRGAYAIVTTGPSTGTVVRLIRQAYAPPGSAGCAVHTLQPPGPVWVVDQWLEWNIWSDTQRREVLFRCKAAPVTALRQIMVLVHPKPGSRAQFI